MPVAGPEPRRRLAPLTPLLRSARLLALLIAGISWRGFSELGLSKFLLVVALGLVGLIALSVVSWWVTGYHVVGRELRIHEGLLWRRTRAIPLERLQSVEVVRPLLARLGGLAELRLEVVGGAKTEAPLAYLSVADAATLRTRLLTLAGHAAPPAPAAGAATAGTPAPAAAADPGRFIHRVDNHDVWLSQLLTPQAWFTPLALGFVLVQFLFEHTWGFIALASTLTAMVSVIQQPVRRVLTDWDFRLAADHAGLRLRHGLLETRSQTVPLNRVQAVGLTWPLLWRPKGWLRARLDVAGIGHDRASQENLRSGRLLPVATVDTARRVLPEALPGVDLANLPVTPPPPRARWLTPIARPAAGLTDRVFVTWDGRLTRELVLVPYARIQSVRVVRGPVQRLLGLATVHADTAGSLAAAARYRDLDEAWAIAADLANRARAARAAAAPPTPPASTWDASGGGAR
nr:PH domain-containing protein [Micromonospora sp. NBRC 107566]